MKKKVIIDVDTGVDDAQAIMLALSSDEIEVLAITCVQGNTHIDNVCKNTLRTLKVCNRLDIPVFRGCTRPLTGIVPVISAFHGEDGLGDTQNPPEVDTGHIQSEHAVVALLRIIRENPGEITLIALAPLTNVAMAVRLDPDIGSKLKEVVIMGGNIEGSGNTFFSPAAEFNFAYDPESAYVVLNELECPKLNVSWETCLNEGMTMDWYTKWISVDTEKGRFIKSISHGPAMFYLKKWNRPYTSCDLLTMAIVINDNIATDVGHFYATVELTGTLSKGQMVVDWRGFIEKPPNMKIVKKVDYEEAKKLFFNMVL